MQKKLLLLLLRHKYLVASGAPPQTTMGELTMLPYTHPTLCLRRLEFPEALKAP